MSAVPDVSDEVVWRSVMRLVATAHRSGVLSLRHGRSAVARLLLWPARRWRTKQLNLLNLQERQDVPLCTLIPPELLPPLNAVDAGETILPCYFCLLRHTIAMFSFRYPAIQRNGLIMRQNYERRQRSTRFASCSSRMNFRRSGARSAV
jgi:hypothetical protein